MYADKLFNLIILGLVKYLSTWQMDWVSFRVEHHFTLTCLQNLFVVCRSSKRCESVNLPCHGPMHRCTAEKVDQVSLKFESPTTATVCFTYIVLSFDIFDN